MLLVTIILFLHYDLHSCLHNGKSFNEDLLMRLHHQNFLQINDFIKEAQHRFHEEKPLLGVRNDEHETTRDDKSLDRNTTWWWDNSSFIDQLGLNTPRSFLFPLIRSRPTFPFSITPYTTELNDRHLKWDEIFTDRSAGLRSGTEVSSPQLNRSIPQSSTIPSPKGQKSFDLTFHPPTLHDHSRPLLFNTTSRSNTILKDKLGLNLGFTNDFITPNEHYMMWLREITMYTPVEKWLQTLATKIVTPSNGYTTNHTTQVSHIPYEPQTSAQNRQLKNDFKDLPQSILRQSRPLSDGADYRTATATTKAQFFIINVSGILHLRTVIEKDLRTTMMLSGRPVTISDDADMVTTTSARDVLRREQDPKTSGLSFRKSRRFHSKARKRKRYHHSHKRKRTGRRQKHSHTYPKHSDDYRNQKQDVEYPMLRRMRETTEGSRIFSLNTQILKRKKKQKPGAMFSNAVTRLTENTNLRESTYLPTLMSQFLSEQNNIKDEEHVKFFEAQDKLWQRKSVPKDKISVHHEVKEGLKTAEKEEKDNRLKVKAELIRKIVAGSSYSYSDEEATLRKNLVVALRYGKRT